MDKRLNFVKIALHISGLLFCILPPALATLCYFPLWKASSAGHTLAGGCTLLLILCAGPLYKYVRRLTASPSSYVMWLIIFLVFFVTEKIAYEMTVISFVGLLGNLLGAICFRLAGRRSRDGTGI